jgi:hypothetical protein
VDERPPHRAEEGPTLGDLYLLPLGFLATGLVALAGSLYAMEDVWRETGRPIKELLRRWNPEFDPPNPSGYAALRLITWGLLILGLAYIFMLVTLGL